MLQNENNKRETILSTVAILCICVGVVGMYLYFIQGIKPEWLQLKVFTVYSKYLDTKSFTFIKNNQADEISVTLYWIGWLLVVYQQEKSFFCSRAVAIIVFIMGYLLIHGLAVIYFVFIYIFCCPLFLLFNSKTLNSVKFYFSGH
jgi:hypothetical protein